MDVMLAQDLFDRLDSHLDGRFITARTILSQQILEHIGGDNGIPLHRLDEILTNHETRKVSIYFLIKFVHHSTSIKNQNHW